MKVNWLILIHKIPNMHSSMMIRVSSLVLSKLISIQLIAVVSIDLAYTLSKYSELVSESKNIAYP